MTPALAATAVEQPPPRRRFRDAWRWGRCRGGAEAVGIDVGTAELSFASVIRRRDGWHWTARGTVKYPQPLSCGEPGEGRTAPTPEAVYDVITAALPRPADGRRLIAAATLPPPVTVLRSHGESSENFAASIRTELGASVSPQGSVESCSWSLNDTSRRMVYAVSGSAGEATAEAIRKCGFHCRRIDSRPHALARSLSLDETGGATIVLEWGVTDCMLVFAQAARSGGPRLPSVCRYIRGYGLDAAGRIAGCSDQEPAPPLVQASSGGGEAALPGRLADRNRAILAPLVKAAAAEITRSIRYADSINGADTSGPLVLCGAAGRIWQLPELLSDELDRPVRPWRWGGQSRPRQHPYAPDDCLFAVPISLACGELTR